MKEFEFERRLSLRGRLEFLVSTLESMEKARNKLTADNGCCGVLGSSTWCPRFSPMHARDGYVILGETGQSEKVSRLVLSICQSDIPSGGKVISCTPSNCGCDAS